LVTVTATFRMLYVFVVIEHGTRRLRHMNLETSIDDMQFVGDSGRLRFSMN